MYYYYFWLGDYQPYADESDGAPSKIEASR
jgi:hypothetical protein